MSRIAIILAASAFLAAAPATSRDGQPQHTGAEVGFQTLRPALMDAWIAALEAGLRLQEDQLELFAPVAEALRSGEDDRHLLQRNPIPAGDASTSPGAVDFADELERDASIAEARGRHRKQLAEAVRPLWDTLSVEQRAVFSILMREGMGIDQGMGLERGVSTPGAKPQNQLRP